MAKGGKRKIRPATDSAGLRAFADECGAKAAGFEALMLKFRAIERQARSDADEMDRLMGEVEEATLTTSLDQIKVSEQMLAPEVAQSRNLAISLARVKDDPVLRAARERRGWSQNDLAEQLGVSSATVGNWRKGVTSIPREHAERLKKELGLPATRSTWRAGVRD